MFPDILYLLELLKMSKFVTAQLGEKIILNVSITSHNYWYEISSGEEGFWKTYVWKIHIYMKIR